MQEILKNKKGITLIALVVTIVVILILAGISIATLTGDNSVIRKASEAQILTELSNVDEALEIYKIQKHSDGDMSDEELVEDGLLKEIFIKDTYRTLGIITDLEEINVNGKLGKSGAKLEETKVDIVQNLYDKNLYDVYAIDMTDGTLYYIRDGIWSIEGKKVIRIAENGKEEEVYVIETVSEEYIEEYIKAKQFITEWTVGAGTTIKLPITTPAAITIEWGDGTNPVTLTHTDQLTHIYEQAGTYEIKIAGPNNDDNWFERWSFLSVQTSKDYITAIKQWGDINCKYIDFANCTNLGGSIPDVEQNAFKKVQSFKVMFQNCTKLTGSIPKNLFKNCSAAIDFSAVFSGCTGLTGEVPEGLFLNCSKVVYFSNLFYNCKNLEGIIPKNLFANCTEVKDINRAFVGCSGLTGAIPENLFKDCTKLENVGEFFYGCSGLTGNIPEKLFEHNTVVENISGCFNGCTGLSGNIPEDLFKTCTEVKNLQGIFINCTGLTGQIPEGLFSNCSKVTNYGKVFLGCKGLTGSIPKNLFANCTEVNDVNAAFYGCSGLTGEIPENLFKDCTKITNARETFINCSGLTGSIPKNLFSNNININNLYGTFSGCTGLTGSIPQNLFENNPNITNFEITFRGCTGLTGTAPKIWERDNVTSYKNCFGNCQNLSNYNEIPAAWGGGGA